MYSCYACNFYAAHRWVTPLLFVFSKHSKNVYQPSWRDSVAVSSRCFFPLFPFPAIGSAKVIRSFLLGKRKRKFLFSGRLACGEWHAVRAIRGAKVRNFFDWSTLFSTFVVLVKWTFEAVNPVDSGGVQRYGAFCRNQDRREISFLPVCSARLRSIWECKSTGDFEMGNRWRGK